MCKHHLRSTSSSVQRDGPARPIIIAAASVALLVSLAACAGSAGVGSAAAVTGDQKGGKVPYAEGGMQQAMDAATSHCSQFGKKAQIVQMAPAAQGSGGTLGFQCR
jgi:hypothetical protein